MAPVRMGATGGGRGYLQIYRDRDVYIDYIDI